MTLDFGGSSTAPETDEEYAARMAALQRLQATQGPDTPPSGATLGTTAAQAAAQIAPASTTPGVNYPGEPTNNDLAGGGAAAPTNYPGEPTQNTVTTASGVQAFGDPGGYSGPTQSPDAAARNAATNAATGGSIPTSQQAPSGSVSIPAIQRAIAPTTTTPTAGTQPNSGTTIFPPGTGPGSGAAAPAEPGPIANQGPQPGAGGGAAGGSDLTGMTSAIQNQISQMQAQANDPGAAPDATAVFMVQMQSILGMLDQQEAQMRADNEKAGTTVDPATQFTIDKLREQLTENLKTTRENLNARGLYESGIELQLENNLQKGSASDQAQILATRLSKLQDQLQAGLAQINTQRFSTANAFGMGAANAQTGANTQFRQNAFDRGQTAFQGMLSLRGQLGSEAEAEAARQQQAAQFASGQAFTAAQADAQRAFDAAQAALNRDATAANQARAEQAAADLAAANRAAATSRTTTTTAAPGATGQTGVQAAVSAAQAQVTAIEEQGGDPIQFVTNNAQAIIDAVGQDGYQAILQSAQDAHNQTTQR